MSMRSTFAALAAMVVVAPVALQSQAAGADFSRARQQFVAGDSRMAAQTLLMSSLYVRQQVGRCRDETVGLQLIDAENQLEKLANAIRAGTVGGVKALDRSLARIDVLLAQHHVQLASAGIVRPRTEDIPVVAQDVELAAFHFERSITLDGHALAAEQATVTTDAHALSKEMLSSGAVPKSAGRVVAALAKLVQVTPTMAAER